MTSILRLAAASLSLLLAACAAAGAQSSGYITVDSSRIHYDECGTGPTIVLSHDGVMAAATWDAIWPALCARFHVVRYDRRGSGRSSAPKIAFSQTADLAALLADRHVTNATLVGSSAGGALAIDFALEHPDKVQRLVLIGPVLRGMGFSDHFMQRELANIEPLQRGDVRGAATKLSTDRYALAPGHDSARRTVFETVMASPQNVQSGLTIGRFQQRPDLPASARLGEVRVPTLILVGEYDIPDVHAHAGAIELGIWGARREIVRDAGHLPQIEQPALIRDRIIAFVGETPVVSVPAERLQSLAGTYTPFVRAEPGDFYVKDGRLMAHFAGERDVPLFASSDSTFYALAWRRFEVTFHRDPSGRPSAAEISIGGAAHRATVMTRGSSPTPIVRRRSPARTAAPDASPDSRSRHSRGPHGLS